MHRASDESTHIEFVAYNTRKDGTRVYASEYGLKAFPIRVPNKNN